MKTGWDRRIAHFDRKVSPTAARRLGGGIAKSEISRSRGKPVRAIPAELFFAIMRIKYQRGSVQARTAGLERIQRLLLRERLLQRKRADRRAALAQRRPSVESTNIFLWKRRREWLRDVERTHK